MKTWSHKREIKQTFSVNSPTSGTPGAAARTCSGTDCPASQVLLAACAASALVRAYAGAPWGKV